MKITIIGTGAYGIGIAMMLAKKNNNNIVMWTESNEKYQEFQKTHKINSIFPDLEFPTNITLTTDLEIALEDTNLIFLITKAEYVALVCDNIRPFYKNTPICIASKGIDSTTLNTLSTLVRTKLQTKNIAVISGPTFAIDLIHNEPTALAIAGLNKKTIQLVKDNLANATLKLRTSSDLIGIELCGSLKNIIAIAAGILKGLGYSESTEAFLINESLHDIKNIIHILGGKRKTILSFAGIGDLLLTCSSPKSRNYSFGYLIGQTKDQIKIQKYLKENTVEGYYTLNSVHQMLEKKGIDIPLITIINNIVCHGTDPEELVTFLINKP